MGILPADHFDPDEAVRQIRAYLAGERAAKPLPPASPAETFATETARLLKVLQRVATGDTIRAARTADPEGVRQALASIRAMLDEIERQVTS